jgi:dihydrofolate synthase/folylpolyglutamate synthase
VDGAHNAASAVSLRETIVEVFGDLPWVLVLGCSADKDLPTLAATLVPGAHAVVLTRTAHGRAAPISTLARVVSEFRRDWTVSPDPGAALEAAVDRCPATGFVVVAGSLFLAGEVLEATAAPYLACNRKSRADRVAPSA